MVGSRVQPKRWKEYKNEKDTNRSTEILRLQPSTNKQRAKQHIERGRFIRFIRDESYFDNPPKANTFQYLKVFSSTIFLRLKAEAL